ncbi:hypothetical protein CfE428DRAFT_3836 [Chthoniobacter flavus Ellin428]|uniref:Tetratricopeptide repeat protein n=1 Tax=Chthoniobacter flavus Ellin428 TaxID=497964 RepID=B4D4J8_9BACT|nr:hypothetical protein [Chthoniobacter flavus]EDY18451.1 hypothetical protein CfE428DRAFT_3836 [Chthoniobacter flavus Ellin428]TCO91085.1 hypothetical protein EV701_109239 [Chthoniobacter flavus]
MNTRILCLAGWLAAAGISAAQSSSPAASPSASESWQQLTRQWPKAATDLDAEGDRLADTGDLKDAAARYQSCLELPGATSEQKALATIKLAQLSEAQFEIATAREAYQKALTLLPPKSGIAHEIRLRLEDTYRRADDLSGLADMWKNYVASHGDDADASLLLAQVLDELRQPIETATWPKPPLPPASQPAGEQRVATAKDAAFAALRGPKFDEEYKILTTAFDTESDPLARFDLTAALGEAANRMGRLNELVATFRTRSRTEKEGWRYFVYLAEIQRSIQNASAAHAELMRALGPRSRDPLFLTEAWRLSIEQQDLGDRVRLGRLLAEVSPSTAHQIELISALFYSHESTDALKGLQANEDAIFADPMPWHDVLLLAGAVSQGEITSRLLESFLAKKPGDWRGRFLLAEARMQAGDFVGAKKYLRELEAAAPPVQAPGENNKDELRGYTTGAVTYDSGIGHGAAADFARRNVHGAGMRDLLDKIGSGLNNPAFSLEELPHFSAYNQFPSRRHLPQTAAEAADAALVIHSVLERQEGHSAEWMAELQPTLAKLPRAERIARLALVQALDPLLQELTAEATAPSGDELTQAIGLEVLLELGANILPGTGRVDVDPSVLSSLLKAFLAREKHPDTLVLGQVELSKVLKLAGQGKEAVEAARTALEGWKAVPADRQYMAMDLAMATGDVEHAEAMLTTQEEKEKAENPGSPYTGQETRKTQLARVIAEQNPDDPRLMKWLVSGMQDTFDRTNLRSSLWQGRSILHAVQKFPYDGRLIYRFSWSWFEIFEIPNQYGKGAALRTAISQKAKELPSPRNLHARLAVICLSWWMKDRDRAIHEALDLATATGNDEVHLLAGSMLTEMERYDEARGELEKVSTTDPDIASDQVARLLVLARAQKDNERAKTLAVQLAGFPSIDSDDTLERVMKDLGLQEQALNFQSSKRAKSEVKFYTGMAGAVKELERESAARNLRTATGLAHGILARVSPLGTTAMERYYRRAALDALRRGSVLTEYTDELKRQLAANPQSLETVLRLADAFENDAAQAVTYARRAVELRPNDLSLQLRLGGALAANRQPADAVRVWEAVFAKDPQAIFSEGFNGYLATFKAAGQLDQFSTILLKTPPGNLLAALAFFSRDTTFYYQQVAEAMNQDGKPAEAIQLWQAALARARRGTTSSFQETNLLQSLIPALLKAGRKDEAIQEFESYFLPPVARQPWGYKIVSPERKWSQTIFQDHKSSLQGTKVMQLASDANVLDALRAKAAAVAAAHPHSPEQLLVLWIDILKHNPARLASMKKEFDEILDELQSTGRPGMPDRLVATGLLGDIGVLAPWAPQTRVTLRSLADVLAEWPEGRELALHIDEKLPDLYDGRPYLDRAKLALSISQKEAANRALQEWISWDGSALRVASTPDVEQNLTAADLMTQAGLPTEAKKIIRRLQITADFRDTKQRLMAMEVLNRAGLAADVAALLQTIKDSEEFHRGAVQLSVAETINRMGMNSEAVAILLKIKASDLYNLELQLSAAELMNQVGMTTQAAELVKKIQASPQLRKQPDLQKRLDELVKRLGPGSKGKPGETIKL